MSYRTTFVTSFLYYKALVPILRISLASLSVQLLEAPGKVMDNERTVWFAGQAKNLWSYELEEWAENLVSLLPKEYHFEVVFTLGAEGSTHRVTFDYRWEPKWEPELP